MDLDLLQHILKHLALEYLSKRSTDSTTGGRFCEPCQSRLETVDAKLYALLKEVNELLRIRADAKENFNQHHDYVTRHLPAEITSHIFVMYTENFNSNFDPRDPIVERGGPLRLGAVSQSWRRIAFGTPRLWNTANIHIQWNDNLPTKVELTKQWLDRSQQLPLYLSLVSRTSYDDDEPEPDSLAPLFNVLRSVAPRWCKLVLGIHPELYSAFLGKLTCAPTLDTLKLIDEDGAEGKFYLPYTPSLKHLIIPGMLISDISIQWRNLTTFEVECVAEDEFFEVLRLAEGLESFRSDDFIESLDNHALPETPLTHAALKALYLAMSEPETTFDLMSFPSLERFEYRCSSFLHHRTLQSLFNRSHCQLTHLTLSGDFQYSSLPQLISILSDLATITHLKLEDSHTWDGEEGIMSDELLERLASTLHGEVVRNRLLPRLESLEFQGDKTFSWSYLAGLVSTTSSNSGRTSPTSSREGSPHSIRRVSFRVYCEDKGGFIDAHSVARFKNARDAGISIVIMHAGPPRRSPSVLSLNRRYPFDLVP